MSKVQKLKKWSKQKMYNIKDFFKYRVMVQKK